ncbi:hypothetical protein PoMZ_06840 [Pyricularia oryzae]|uniref:Uncharacterized protein n=1 Tax=Pyricularia oryzae TaxID=318829 RepID=A0A4P7NRS9_PYROR|nr:hypothetical protein PoMZ_06840 [Pyricularia oryzae]
MKAILRHWDERTLDDDQKATRLNREAKFSPSPIFSQQPFGSSKSSQLLLVLLLDHDATPTEKLPVLKLLDVEHVLGALGPAAAKALEVPALDALNTLQTVAKLAKDVGVEPLVLLVVLGPGAEPLHGQLEVPQVHPDPVAVRLQLRAAAAVHALAVVEPRAAAAAVQARRCVVQAHAAVEPALHLGKGRVAKGAEDVFVHARRLFVVPRRDVLAAIAAAAAAAGLAVVSLRERRVQLGQEHRHAQRARVAGAVHAAAVVDHVLGQAHGGRGVADQVARDDVAPAQGQGDADGPRAALRLARLPQRGQQPRERLVVALRAQHRDEVVEVHQRDVRQRDAHRRQHVQHLPRDGRRGRQQLGRKGLVDLSRDGLRGGDVEVLAAAAVGQGQAQDQDQLREAGVGLVAVVGRDVGPGGGGQVGGVVVPLLGEQLLHAADAADADGAEEVLRGKGAKVAQQVAQQHVDLLPAQLDAPALVARKVGRELVEDALGSVEALVRGQEAVQARGRGDDGAQGAAGGPQQAAELVKVHVLRGQLGEDVGGGEGVVARVQRVLKLGEEHEALAATVGQVEPAARHVGLVLDDHLAVQLLLDLGGLVRLVGLDVARGDGGGCGDEAGREGLVREDVHRGLLELGKDRLGVADHVLVGEGRRRRRRLLVVVEAHHLAHLGQRLLVGPAVGLPDGGDALLEHLDDALDLLRHGRGGGCAGGGDQVGLGLVDGVEDGADLGVVHFLGLHLEQLFIEDNGIYFVALGLLAHLGQVESGLDGDGRGRAKHGLALRLVVDRDLVDDGKVAAHATEAVDIPLEQGLDELGVVELGAQLGLAQEAGKHDLVVADGLGESPLAPELGRHNVEGLKGLGGDVVRVVGVQGLDDPLVVLDKNGPRAGQLGKLPQHVNHPGVPVAVVLDVVVEHLLARGDDQLQLVGPPEQLDQVGGDALAQLVVDASAGPHGPVQAHAHVLLLGAAAAGVVALGQALGQVDAALDQPLRGDDVLDVGGEERGPDAAEDLFEQARGVLQAVLLHVQTHEAARGGKGALLDRVGRAALLQHHLLQHGLGDGGGGGGTVAVAADAAHGLHQLLRGAVDALLQLVVRRRVGGVGAAEVMRAVLHQRQALRNEPHALHHARHVDVHGAGGLGDGPAGLRRPVLLPGGGQDAPGVGGAALQGQEARVAHDAPGLALLPQRGPRGGVLARHALPHVDVRLLGQVGAALGEAALRPHQEELKVVLGVALDRLVVLVHVQRQHHHLPAGLRPPASAQVHVQVALGARVVAVVGRGAGAGAGPELGRAADGPDLGDGVLDLGLLLGHAVVLDQQLERGDDVLRRVSVLGPVALDQDLEDVLAVGHDDVVLGGGGPARGDVDKGAADVHGDLVLAGQQRVGHGRGLVEQRGGLGGEVDLAVDAGQEDDGLQRDGAGGGQGPARNVGHHGVAGQQRRRGPVLPQRGLQQHHGRVPGHDLGHELGGLGVAHVGLEVGEALAQVQRPVADGKVEQRVPAGELVHLVAGQRRQRALARLRHARADVHQQPAGQVAVAVADDALVSVEPAGQGLADHAVPEVHEPVLHVHERVDRLERVHHVRLGLVADALLVDVDGRQRRQLLDRQGSLRSDQPRQHEPRLLRHLGRRERPVHKVAHRALFNLVQRLEQVLGAAVVPYLLARLLGPHKGALGQHGDARNQSLALHLVHRLEHVVVLKKVTHNRRDVVKDQILIDREVLNPLLGLGPKGNELDRAGALGMHHRLESAVQSIFARRALVQTVDDHDQVLAAHGGGAHGPLHGLPEDVVVVLVGSKADRTLIGLDEDVEELDVSCALLKQLVQQRPGHGAAGRLGGDPRVDGDKQSVVSDASNGVLQVVENHRREYRLARSLGSAQEHGLLGALEEAGQVGADVQARQLLAVVSQVRGRVEDAGHDVVLWCDPLADCLELGNCRVY